MRMFEAYTECLQRRIKDALSGFVPLPIAQVQRVAQDFHGVPKDYLDFLEIYGYGGMRLGEYLDTKIAEVPFRAVDYFGEERYYVTSDFPAPKGEVVGFATDEVGSLYGFDSGDEWRMVCVDGRRDVVRFKLSFIEFVAGVVCCDPYMPFEKVPGGWTDEGGNLFLDDGSFLHR